MSKLDYDANIQDVLTVAALRYCGNDLAKRLRNKEATIFINLGILPFKKGVADEVEIG